MLRYVVLLAAVAACAEDGRYQASIAKWRAEREAALRADGGWLTVTGLVWLKEGENRVEGAGGVFEFHDGKTVFRAADRVIEMKSDTKITTGSKTFTVI